MPEQYVSFRQVIKPNLTLVKNRAHLDRPRTRWRKIVSHPFLMYYNRLILFVFLLNLGILCLGISDNGFLDHILKPAGWQGLNSAVLSTVFNLILGNIGIAVLIRQPYIINLLFKISTSVPLHWPLAIRKKAANIYHLGGIHVGGSIAGTLWFLVLTGLLTLASAHGLAKVSLSVVVVSYAILVLLAVMIVLALPPFREKFHDYFERSHRLGGWTVLGLFWVQAVLFINDQRGNVPFGEALLNSPAFWVLSAIATSIALPWLHLRKVPISIEKPSSHVALVQFNHGVRAFPGAFTTISRRPLLEWHSFANVPAPTRPGFRLTISRAGDWTGQFIDDLPSHVWVKGIPTAGVASIAKLFKRVVWVATGSGIGPVLPHLLSQEVPSRLIWSTRAPEVTYGDALVAEILEVQPNALIWDTDHHGRPDLVKLALDIYGRSKAEAVICISNKKLTWEVVRGIESFGIPAYGAIWDS
jgi:hypothetical protein